MSRFKEECEQYLPQTDKKNDYHLALAMAIDPVSAVKAVLAVSVAVIAFESCWARMAMVRMAVVRMAGCY